MTTAEMQACAHGKAMTAREAPVVASDPLH